MNSITVRSQDQDNLPVAVRATLFQFEVIRRIGREGKAVLVGRCADYVLRGQENLLTVFIHADMKSRITRVAARNDISAAEVETRIRNTDKHRAAYYNYYADGRWGDSTTYQLCIDSGRFGIEGAVELL